MAAIADITVFDGESTPVQHVFVADHVEYDGKDIRALYGEKVVGVPEYAQGSIVISMQTMKSSMKRVGLRVNLPVMEAVAGQNAQGYTAPPKVAYVEGREVVQWCHPRSTWQGRQNAATIARNIGSNVSTTTGSITAGVMYEALVRLVMPN